MLAFDGRSVGLRASRSAACRLLVSLAERYSPRANEIRLDGMVLGFTLLLSLLVAVLLSFAPKLAKEGTLGSWVAAGVNRMSGGLRRQRLQRGLVVAQIAVSVMLLDGRRAAHAHDAAALRGGHGSQQPRRCSTMEVPFDFAARKDEDAKALFERMQLEVAAHSGRERGRRRLDDAAAQRRSSSSSQGRRAAARQRRSDSARRVPHGEPGVLPCRGHSAARGTRVRRDRPKTVRRAVVILNKTLADSSFRTAIRSDSASRGRARCCKFIGLSGEWRTVVGVVGDTKDGGLDAAPRGVDVPAVDAGSDVRAAGS